MTMYEAEAELLRRLGSLRVLEPDSARLARVRSRCHGTLVKRRQRLARRKTRNGFSTRALESALVGGLSASYLLAILFVLLRLRGIL